MEKNERRSYEVRTAYFIHVIMKHVGEMEDL